MFGEYETAHIFTSLTDFKQLNNTRLSKSSYEVTWSLRKCF